MGNICAYCTENQINLNDQCNGKINNRSDNNDNRYIIGTNENNSDDYINEAAFVQQDCSNLNYGSNLMSQPLSFDDSSFNNLQHISEREPDDFDEDPSQNATKATLFMQRSLKEVEASIKKRQSIYDLKVSKKRYHFALLHRCSSTSSILLDDSTVSKPDCKSTVRALSTVIYCHIRNRDRNVCYDCMPPCSHCPEIFDERLHSLTKDAINADALRRDPDQKSVYKFVRTLFQSAQLSPEYAIVTVIYLERLLNNAEIEIGPTNWKRIVLSAILLASKVWDDQAVWNVDYCQILRDLKIDDVNELERQFLEILQFNINIPSSVYAKYYFDIRRFSDSAQHPFPLSWDRALKLEAIGRICEDPFNDIVNDKKKIFKRCESHDSFVVRPHFRPAILP